MSKAESVSYESLPDFLTHNELCQFLRVGHNTAYKLTHTKGFPRVPVGNRNVFPKRLVKEWMERQAERQAAPQSLRAVAK